MAQALVRTRSGRLPALIITLRGTAVEHPLSACLAEQTRSIGPIKSAHRVKRRTIVLFTSPTRSTTCAPDSGRRCNLPIFASNRAIAAAVIRKTRPITAPMMLVFAWFGKLPFFGILR